MSLDFSKLVTHILHFTSLIITYFTCVIDVLGLYSNKHVQHVSEIEVWNDYCHKETKLWILLWCKLSKTIPFFLIFYCKVYLYLFMLFSYTHYR